MRVVADLDKEIVCHEHVSIRMRDGAHLAARIWLPKHAARHPVPAILEYIPYRKRDLTRRRDAINHVYFAAMGYACIRVDLRGSGESEGVLQDQYLAQEQDDGCDCIDWISKQAWCNGKVGMFGISWGGFAALQIAARRPEALHAIIAVCATDDLYVDNMHYMGGCLLSDNLSEASTMLAFNSCPPDPALVGDAWKDMWLERLRSSGLWLETWLAHQHRDDYWLPASVREHYDDIRCPALLVSGWADGFTNAIFRLLQHLPAPAKGLIGPWEHQYPHIAQPGPTIGFLQESKRWFDHWLKHVDNDVEYDPSLRVWLQDSMPPQTLYHERPGRWVAEEDWPSSRITDTAWYLGPAGGMEREQPPSDVRTIRSPLTVGLFAGKWCSYTQTPDLPADQRLEDGGSLVFETEPLSEDVEILGMPMLQVELSSDQPEAMLAARLSDVRPDGATTRITYGLLNLSDRDGHAHPQPLVPGKTERVLLSLNGVAQRFPRGHRIRLSLSTSYWPLAWPS
ncbi:MAG: CocE/NonD family hydrolase, partial [Planctomycetota bacterium]